ncbi:MAG TPA: hypothetical protein VFG45_04085 [Candidatus Nitrosocosmicus sp.]|nr:hypothetical protein [Candidatus Nitrosocosmicus sp.]
MTVSLKFSLHFTDNKSSMRQSTGNHSKTHRTMLPSLKMTLLVATCMMFVLTAFVPSEVSKVFAQGQQDEQNSDSDKQTKTSPSTDTNTVSKDRVTIDLVSVEFAPLKSSENNQLKIIINYQTNDPSLINSPMAGTMKVYDSDDNIIKTSKITKGYVLGQSGPMQFATSFADKTIKDVKAEVYMTDTAGNKISNTLTTEASLSN